MKMQTMKRVLILTHVASMIGLFNLPNIKLLQEMGYSVDVACNFKKGNVFDEKQAEGLKRTLREHHVNYYQVDFERNVLRVDQNLKVLRQVIFLIRKNNYTFIHCHTPIGGFIGRVAGQLTHTPTMYTAHGFHFYKGAPKKNWLLYYPIEKICSYMTDVLICINKEDYQLAKRKMKAKRIEYIPGVGIQTEVNPGNMEERTRLRDKIGVKEKDILLLSVGELNANKNHMVVLDAIKALKNNNVHYGIAGKGDLKEKLSNHGQHLGIGNRVHFLGFQSNIGDWYEAADIFVFPSYREGLSVSLMEAMSHGKPCIVSDIRGNSDLIENSDYRFNPGDSAGLNQLIQRLLEQDGLGHRMGQENRETIKGYSVEHVMKRTRDLYEYIGQKTDSC